ncbi:MAG: hypothetical protein O2875_00315 [Planctomycetota bacterium]|nr:hypothetical protein [Planctomycetota bacterium]MDA1261369.1 hypothetical protein [Planctomycetota bacterium]
MSDHSNSWQRMRGALKEGWSKAFHIEPPGPAKPNPDEAELVERVAQEIVKRRMAQPAMLFLESSRPLSGVGAAAMHFLQPFVSVVIHPTTWSTLATFLERSGAVEYLCLRIEALEEQRLASDTKASDTKASNTKASDTKASDTKASDTKK